MRALFILFLLSACTGSGPPTTGVEQRFVWFSYLAGDDIRTQCAPNALQRLRYIYNADFNRAVRTVDIVEGEGGARLEARRFDGSSFLRVSSMGLLNEADTASTWLAPEAFDRVKRAAFEDGVLGPPRVGLVLGSHEHYAIAVACADGAFHGQGFPAQDLASSRLFRLLQELDPLDSPWPRVETGTRPPPTSADTRDQFLPYFVVRILPDGLSGGRP